MIRICIGSCPLRHTIDTTASKARRMTAGRDHSLHVISGRKHRNPACAQALIQRLA